MSKEKSYKWVLSNCAGNISHDLRCVFVHIPKTAGNSIKNVLSMKEHCHKPVSRHDEVLVKNYYTFSFVRNPWDRFASAYYYLKSGGRNKNDRVVARKLLSGYSSFDDFIKRVDFDFLFHRSTHFRLQSYYLDAPIDFIGRYENLKNDFDIVCGELNIEACQVPLVNTSKRQPYRNIYTSETKLIIKEKYKEDVESFGYTFEGDNE